MKIMIWPDGEWMYQDDYEDVIDAWRGDDYEVKEVDEIPDN